jgi:hypothetical protein
LAKDSIEIYQGDSTKTYQLSIKDESVYTEYRARIVVLNKVGGSKQQLGLDSLGEPAYEAKFDNTSGVSTDGIYVRLSPGQTNTILSGKYLLVVQLFKNESLSGNDPDTGLPWTAIQLENRLADPSSGNSLFRREIHYDLKVNPQGIGS